jgi:magnesium transporter
MIEDLDEEDQQAVLAEMEPEDRAAIETALAYPEESAGRLMSREFVAVPEHMTVGDLIDYLREKSRLATEFWEVFIVDRAPPPGRHLRAVVDPAHTAPHRAGDVMKRDQTLIPVTMDQEEVALRFQKYALISAAVVDETGGWSARSPSMTWSTSSRKKRARTSCCCRARAKATSTNRSATYVKRACAG